PGLCEFDDVNTFFHEFGHLLHNMFAGHHRWVGVGGIRTESDFIEAPSQMLEEWMRNPKVLQVFAKQYQTGEVVPDSLIKRLRREQPAGSGRREALSRRGAGAGGLEARGEARRELPRPAVQLRRLRTVAQPARVATLPPPGRGGPTRVGRRARSRKERHA